MENAEPRPGAGRLREAFEALAREGIGSVSGVEPAAAQPRDNREPGAESPAPEQEAVEQGATEAAVSRARSARDYRLPELPAGATLEGALEALLLVADAPLALRELTATLGGCDWVPVRRALRALQRRYREHDGGIELIEVAGGWRLVTRPVYAELVERLRTVEREQRMSVAQIETLAIVAYRQPVTRARIDAIRGADSSGVLRTLIERGLVRVAGRADQLGRPFLYGTTGLFLERFGLKSLAQLPRPRALDAPGA